MLPRSCPACGFLDTSLEARLVLLIFREVQTHDELNPLLMTLPALLGAGGGVPLGSRRGENSVCVCVCVHVCVCMW